MRVPITHVTASARHAVAPLRIVDRSLFAQLHVRPPLPDSRAAHAWEIRLTTRLHGQAAIHQMVPRVPFADPVRVHRTDEVARAVGGRHKNLLRAYAVQFGDGMIRKL